MVSGITFIAVLEVPKDEIF